MTFYGYGGFFPGRRRRGSLPVVDPTLLSPGASWNGTAGTGYGGAFPVPADSTRTTAKPFMRELTPHREVFTSTNAVTCGVMALANGGVSKVVFHCEGKTFDVTTMTKRAYVDAAGVARSMWGYFMAFDFAAFPGNGDIDIYYEAVPTDATMQRRVMGPYRYIRDTVLYDIDVTVDPSTAVVTNVNFHTLALAHANLATRLHKHGRIRVKGGTGAGAGGAHLWTQPGLYTTPGWLTIEPMDATPVEIKNGSFADFRPRHSSTRFRNIKLDVFDMWGSEYTEWWLDTCEVYSSGGKNALNKGFIRAGTDWIKQSSTMNWTDKKAFVTDCYIHDKEDGARNAYLVRNTRIKDVSYDVLSAAGLCHGVEIDDVDPTFWYTETPLVTFQGPAGATVEKSSGGVFTFKVSGTTTGTITTPTATVAGGTAPYRMPSEFKTQFDSLAMSGWTMTVLNNTTYAMLYANLTDPSGALDTKGAMAATSCSSALTLVAAPRSHTDVSQQRPSSEGTAVWIENRAVVNVRAYKMVETQALYLLDDFTASAGGRDMFFVNIGAHHDTPGVTPFSQLYSPTQHVCLWHCAIADQEFSLRGSDQGTKAYAPDSYSQIYGSLFYSSSWTGTAAATAQIDSNHFVTGSAPTRQTNSTTGSTSNTLLPNRATGDFTPAGALLSGLVARKVPFDALGNDRPASTVRGPVAA